jgi:hypothetical protein
MDGCRIGIFTLSARLITHLSFHQAYNKRVCSQLFKNALAFCELIILNKFLFNDFDIPFYYYYYHDE